MGVARKIKKSVRGAKVLQGASKTPSSSGKTAIELGKRIANPRNVAKMAYNAAAGEGNSMHKGKPTTKADAKAYQHDIDYDNYTKHGVSKTKVYTGYSDADERLYQSSKKDAHKDPNALAAYLGMGAKKMINKTGLTSRVRDEDVYGPSGKPATPHPLQATSDSYNQ